MRPLSALLSLGLVLVLGGCGGGDADADASSSSPTPSATGSSSTPTPTIEPSVISSLDVIKVTGGFGEAPTVEGGWPVKMDQTRVSVLHQGDGATVTGASTTVEVNYTGVNGRTGQTFDSSFGRQSVHFPLDQVVAGFAKGLQGQRVGSRVLIGMTGEDGYDAGGGNAQADIQIGDSLFFVVDVISTPLSGPSGAAVEPAPGLPTVTDNNGTPSVSIPAGVAAPAELKVAPVIKGEGTAVQETDLITVNYAAVNYADGQTIETTYGQGSQTGPLNTLIPGWRKGLVGQPVGSRVLLVVPPADGYPEGSSPQMYPAGATLVFVVDLLYAQPYA